MEQNASAFLAATKVTKVESTDPGVLVILH
jgi:hypothetical protein